MTILVVDDGEELRETVKMALEEDGYNVVTAADGEEGIARARETKPALILADYRMPKTDGVEFLKRLRQTDSLEETPVVIITVDPQLELRKSATRLGIQGFLVKPFQMNELLQTVHNLLQTT